jgi:Tfp pilus assembly pilus retraction ATPase PilT
MSFKDWIQKGRELGASDLHLESGTPLVARIRGDLAAIGEPIPAPRITETGQELLGGEAWAHFLERGSAEVSLAAGGIRRRLSLSRTPEVIRLTLNAAETGHLVLATMHSASCAEALSRICMSFPAEIQGSIRAQLADALVGVVCQRLDFLPTHRLRVPRCELLLANTGIKGTLRAGQFSYIPNVILAGGEEGMWTFDRYQRWMEQKTDWTHPAAVRTLPADETLKVVSVSKGAPIHSPAEQQTEVTINEEMDLSEITELARKIEERTR